MNPPPDQEHGSSDDSSSDDDLEQIAPDGYGVRRSRRRTNYFHRAWNSLRLHEFDIIYTDLQIVEDLLSMVYMILIDVYTYITFLTDIPLAFINFLIFVANHLFCLATLYFEDFKDYAFYPLTNLDPGEGRRFPPKANRTIDSIPDDHIAETMTRFNKASLRRLLTFLRVPLQFVNETRRVCYTGEECLLVLLTYIAKGHTFCDLASLVFGGDPRDMSFMVKAIVNHLFFTFYHKISGDSLRFWCTNENIRAFRQAIWSRFRQSDELNEYEFRERFELFRIFGFLDCVGHATTRVGGSREHNLIHDVQRAFYSAYFRSHGLKCLLVFLPNGMIGSIFIASLAHNDRGIQNMAGLNDYLVSLMENGIERIGGLHYPSLYGDAIFSPMLAIVPRFDRRALRHFSNELRRYYQQLNDRMAGVRESIEHVFGQLFNLFKLLHHAYMFVLYPSAVPAHRLLVVCYLILNCYACEYQSTAGSFHLRPPDLSVYLPLDEDIPPAPESDDEVLGEVYNFGR